MAYTLAFFLGTAVIIVALIELKKLIVSNTIENTLKLKEEQIDTLLYRTIGIALWPIIFHHFVPTADTNMRKMILPIAWPFMMWVVDVYLIIYGKTSSSNVAMMRVEPSTICSMSFALYGLVGANLAHENSHTFMYAILACIAFGFPVHNLAPGTKEEQIIEIFQRTVTTFCTGLMFAGVVLNQTSKP